MSTFDFFHFFRSSFVSDPFHSFIFQSFKKWLFFQKKFRKKRFFNKNYSFLKSLFQKFVLSLCGSGSYTFTGLHAPHRMRFHGWHLFEFLQLQQFLRLNGLSNVIIPCLLIFSLPTPSFFVALGMFISELYSCYS